MRPKPSSIERLEGDRYQSVTDQDLVYIAVLVLILSPVLGWLLAYAFWLA